MVYTLETIQITPEKYSTSGVLASTNINPPKTSTKYMSLNVPFSFSSSQLPAKRVLNVKYIRNSFIKNANR